jgi:adenosine kinase
MVNEYEFSMIREKTGLTKQEIVDQVDALVITLGQRGSTIETQEAHIHIPVVPSVRVVDPTGVGDAYRAGLVKGLALGVPWEVAGRMGALAAAYVLEQKGTQNHFFTQAEFVARYRKCFEGDGVLDVLLES